MIYLDNNATTQEHFKCTRARKEFEKCFANPSSTSAQAEKAQRKIQKTRDEILKALDLSPKKFYAIFTSGASESNATALASAVDSHWERHGGDPLPHIVSTEIEHKSVLEKLKTLKLTNRAAYTLVKPDADGTTSPESIVDAITPNTVLVAVIGAHNELGTINDVRGITAAVKKHRKSILVHVDAVQMFGKLPPQRMKADSLSASFHKIHGPKGLGVLVVRRSSAFVPQICGTQERGLRGGTENVPAIASARVALAMSQTGRERKNARLRNLCAEFLRHLRLSVLYATDHPGWGPETRPAPHSRKGVILGSRTHRLPHTLLLSVVPRRGEPDMCNVKLREMLDGHGLVVSISSACLSSSAKASHVLASIGAPKRIKRGVVRISFSDYNTLREAKKAAEIFNAQLDRLLARTPCKTSPPYPATSSRSTSPAPAAPRTSRSSKT